MLRFFNSVKLCYFACLKQLIGLKKSGRAKNKVEEGYTGLAGREKTLEKKSGRGKEREEEAREI